MPLKKYNQIFKLKEEEKEALQECYSEPVMMAGEVKTEPSHPGMYSVEPVANQPLAADDMCLPFSLVCYGWVRARNLMMKFLWIYGSTGIAPRVVTQGTAMWCRR